GWCRQLDVCIRTIASLAREISDRFPLTSILGDSQAELRYDGGVRAIETRLVIGVVHLNCSHVVRPTQVEGQPLAGTIPRGDPECSRVLVRYIERREAVAC